MFKQIPWMLAVTELTGIMKSAISNRKSFVTSRRRWHRACSIPQKVGRILSESVFLNLILHLGFYTRSNR